MIGRSGDATGCTGGLDVRIIAIVDFGAVDFCAGRLRNARDEALLARRGAETDFLAVARTVFVAFLPVRRAGLRERPALFTELFDMTTI
ncbi:MAG: hypothetical protein ACR2K5_14865 [Pseudolabrys sp.]